MCGRRVGGRAFQTYDEFGHQFQNLLKMHSGGEQYHLSLILRSFLQAILSILRSNPEPNLIIQKKMLKY